MSYHRSEPFSPYDGAGCFLNIVIGLLALGLGVYGSYWTLTHGRPAWIPLAIAVCGFALLLSQFLGEFFHKVRSTHGFKFGTATCQTLQEVHAAEAQGGQHCEQALVNTAVAKLTLSREVDDRQRTVRMGAVESLGRIGGLEAYWALLPLLQPKCFAFHTDIWKKANKAAVGILQRHTSFVRARENPDEPWLLEQLVPATVIMSKEARSALDELNAELARYLGDVGSAEALKPLRLLARWNRHRSGQVRSAALSAIATIKKRESLRKIAGPYR
jgi:hypothetical protein